MTALYNESHTATWPVHKRILPSFYALDPSRAVDNGIRFTILSS
jgi:hypothetical protein